MDIDRDQILKRAEYESQVADMKQHSDKLIQGLEGSRENHHKRAIWELVQNARDLSASSDIVIRIESDQFKFSHNGLPFTSKTLLSLIKQVSSKSSDKKLDAADTKAAEAEVGQYGTGFITTHTFGRKFRLNGSLEVVEGAYIDLEGFEIDRIAPNSDVLAGKLVEQQNAVYQLIKTGDANREKKNTTFTYIFDDKRNYENADLAITSFTDLYIPLVLTLNPRINSIRIEHTINNSSVSFRKVGKDLIDGLFHTIIEINSQRHIIYSIRDDEADIEVILPFSGPNTAAPWQKDISKLFLYFPLIGTEHWGTNFIIHCSRFAPTEKRDGLHLASDNPATSEKENSNKLLIEKASALIFQFLKANCEQIQDPVNLASVSFPQKSGNPHLDEYYAALQITWVKSLFEFKMVETDTGLLQPKEVSFFSMELCTEDDTFDAVYALASAYWQNLPKKAIARKWTEIVLNWADSNVAFVQLEDLLAKIQSSGTIDGFDPAILKTFYTFIIATDRTTLFDKYKLLPNIKDQFVVHKELTITKAIPDHLVEIADVLVPELSKKFLNTDFELTLQYSYFSRSQLTKEFNAKIGELVNKAGAGKQLELTTRNALIKLCSIFPSLSNKGVRGELMPLICKFYDIIYAEIQLPNEGEDAIDHFTPFKCLVRYFLFDVLKRSQEDAGWVESNLKFLNSVLFQLYHNKEFEEMIKAFQIYPTQNFTLESQSKLSREENIPEDLKTLYYDVLNKPIKNSLVENSCAEFLTNENKKTGSELAIEIQQFFESQGTIENINEHPSKKTILGIIKKFKEGDDAWAKLFFTIADKKEVIMMARITKEDMKENMFSILELEDSSKILLLGDLAKSKDMERIIMLGKQSLQSEQDSISDFQFKHSLGTHIEALLVKLLGKRLTEVKVSVEPQQGGQDIICKHDGKPFYFIEVKSRWSKDYSITMSNLQLRTSIENKDKYALCCVNMVDYSPDGGDRHFPEDIALILDRIKVLPQIGEAVEKVMESVLGADRIEGSVNLTGDYRAVVPQVLVNAGQALEDLVNILYSKIPGVIQNT